MSIFFQFIFIFNIFNHGFDSVQFAEASAEKATCVGTGSLAQTQIWCQDPEQGATSEAFSDSGLPSFTGPHFPQKYHHGCREFCVDVPMRATMWQAPQLLPRLSGALDERNSAFQSAQIAQGTHRAGQLGLAGLFEKRTRCKKETTTGLDKECERKGQSQQRTGEGQRQECPVRAGFPFCAGYFNAMACARDLICLPISFQQSDSGGTGSSAASEHRCCVRCGAHPGSEGRVPRSLQSPLRIQNAVAKAEKTTPKLLTSGLHKTSHAVGTATKELKNLRDAKVKHRERWIRHLQDSVKSWEQQLKLYNEQQTNYNNLIKKAKQDLDSARQTLEVLNKKAAGPEDQDSEVNQEEQSRLDSEATIMVQQVQEVLQACAKAATKVETMEISDGEEVPNVPAPKRQRSLEPFAGGPTAPAS